MTKIESNKLNVILYPPYNPDLTSSNFDLFSHLTRNIQGQQIVSEDYLRVDVLNLRNPYSFKKYLLNLSFDGEMY